MDLRFSRVKSEIIKKVEASEDGALLDWILQELESESPVNPELAQPLSEDEYKAKVEKGLASAKNGPLYTSKEMRERYANRKRNTPV